MFVDSFSLLFLNVKFLLMIALFLVSFYGAYSASKIAKKINTGIDKDLEAELVNIYSKFLRLVTISFCLFGVSVLYIILFDGMWSWSYPNIYYYLF